MKNKKRLIACLAMLLAMVLLLTACGNKPAEPAATEAPAAETAVEEAATEAKEAVEEAAEAATEAVEGAVEEAAEAADEAKEAVEGAVEEAATEAKEAVEEAAEAATEAVEGAVEEAAEAAEEAKEAVEGAVEEAAEAATEAVEGAAEAVAGEAAEAAGEAETPAQSGKVISLFLGGGTPLSMDPALNSASAGSNIIRSAFAGLTGFQYDENGEPVMSPELAESYEISEDGLTYSFVLRENLKWSDGTDCTATQIKDAWERAASAELGADYGFLYDVISRNEDGTLAIDVDDAARTFVVHLPQPCAYFLDLCAFVPFYPVRVDLADNEGIWATKPESYVGLGAFKMTEYSVDDKIVFEKNPYYWNADAVKLDGLTFYLSEDNTAILTAYENNTVDYIQSISSSEFDRLNATYPGELEFYPTQGTYYILFNVYKDLSPEAKQLTVQEQSKARFALGQLVNRYEVVTYVTKGGEVQATGFFPKGLADGLNNDVRAAADYGVWYEGTNEPSDVNPDLTKDQVAALQTLMDLGYPYTGTIEGGDLTFTDFPSIEFAFNNSGNNALIIQYVQETWNRFGIKGEVNQEAWATLQTKLKAGDAEAARMGWVADFNDVVNFLEIFISDSGNNYPRLGRDIGDYKRNSEVTADAGVGAYWGVNGDQTWAEAYDAVVDAVKAATDPAERAKLAADAEKILMATGGVNPLYYYTTAQMLKPNVHDVIRLATGDVIWTYADKD